MSGERVPLRADLVDLEPYGVPQLDVAVRLNTNETAEPPPDEFAVAVAAQLRRLDLHRYPDREAAAVRERLAAVEGLDVDRVWAANGSNEVLHHMLLAYGGAGRTALGFSPGYSLYPHLTRVTATRFVEADLPDDLALDTSTAEEAVARHDPDVVLVAHPNNPTGVPVALDVLRSLHDVGRGLVIVDEAYVEFGAETSRPLLEALPRLVITRTFSKALRLAGLRFGYLLAHDWVVEDLRRVRLPYHLDTIKQATALAALDLGPAMLTHVPRVVAERDRLVNALADIGGVEASPSRANFVLVRSERPGLYDRLLERGVLVRDVSGTARLEGCVRVTIGTPEDNDAFLAALREAERS